jgi:signal transduction histidine kinase/putative methionine-R-sulfoxide reductase with GAF domain
MASADRAEHLRAFIQAHRDEMVREWAGEVRASGASRGLSGASLVNHLPEILDDIARLIGLERPRRTWSDLQGLGESHAVDRLAHGFELGDVVTEFRLLRRAVAKTIARNAGTELSVEEREILDVALDEVVRQAIVEYATSRERVLQGLNEVSEAAARTTDLDSFLHALLQATVHTLPSVDTAAVLVRDDDTLRVRATIGLEEELMAGFMLRLGEGFAGRVAMAGEPVELMDAANDPVVKSPIIREKGIRALYGVPLVQSGEVIGVAHIGSLRAERFGDEDKLLFRTMASRAASFIAKARLQVRLQRAESVQRMLASVGKTLSESLDTGDAVEGLAHAAVPAFADACFVDLITEQGTRRASVASTGANHSMDLAAGRPPDLNEATPVGRVLRTGKAEWADPGTRGALALSGGDTELRALLESIDVRSYIVVAIPGNNRISGAITLTLGPSGRRYAEQDVAIAEDMARRAAAAIENARLYREMKSAVEIRDKLLAVVSHDLRNELSVIISSNTVLKKIAEAEGFTRCLDTIAAIERGTSNMRRLVADLVDTAAIRAGRLALVMEPAAADELLDRAAQAYRSRAEMAGIGLESESCGGDVWVTCDRVRVHQVLGNLIGNAIRYCPRGSRLLLSCRRSNDGVELVVADDGPGIPLEQQRRLFEPFTSMERSGKAGTGLGLFISRGIVERHGGTLVCESVPGEGARFTIRLPATPPSRTEGRPSRP